MKLKGLLLMGLSVGVVGMTQLDVAHAESPWLNITDKSVPRTDFIDISSNNGIPSVQDFKIMKSYGVKGVVIKLTEGTVYRNPYAATQIANAKAAGLNVGAYHYSWYENEEEARVQGRYFAQFAKELGLPTNTPMADDLEEQNTKRANMNGQVNSNAKAFRAGVASVGYTNNILYTYGSYATETGLNTAGFGKKNVWMASYPFTPSKDSLWHTDLGMWQFNSNMHFPNVNGTFDANIDYVGTMTGGAQDTAPKPKPKPTSYKAYFKFNQTNRTDGLFANAPYRYEGAKKVGTAPHGSTVWVEKREVASNGVVWYYAKVNGQYVWFDAKAGALLKVSDVRQENVNANYVFDQTKRNDGMYRTAPYGFAGATYYGKATHGTVVKVEKKLVNDGTTWFYGTVNGQKLWFDAKAVKLQEAPMKTTTVNTYMKLNQSVRNDGMYENAPYGYTGARFAGRMPHGNVVWVEKQHVSNSGTIWYFANVNGKKVWFDARAGSLLKPSDLTQTTVNARYVFEQTNRNDGMYQTAPYGFAGAKYFGKANHGVEVTVEKQVVNNGTTWFYGTVNGQKLWFDARAVKPQEVALSTSTVNTYMKLNQSVRKDGMYANAPYGYAGARFTGRMPHGNVVWVEKQHVSKGGIVWYYANVNGQKVWFDAKAGTLLKPTDLTQTTVNARYVFEQTKRNDGMYQTAPYGFAGAKYYGKAKHGVTVTVDKKLVNNGTTWFYGTVNGQKLWFDARAVKPVSAKKAMAISEENETVDNTVKPSVKVSSKRESKAATSSSSSERVSEVKAKETSQVNKGQLEENSIVQDVKFDFVFDQTKRKDDLYKEVKDKPADAKILRLAVDKEVLHVTKQYVDEDGTIWYGAKLNKDFVWFEAKAGRVQI